MLAAILVLLVVGFMFWGRSKKFDERVTLKRKDKIPYGCDIIFSSLPGLFNKESVTVNHLPASELESEYGHRNAFILVSKYFNAPEEDILALVRFARTGNDVFISASEWNSMFLTNLKLTVYGNEEIDDKHPNIAEDSLSVELRGPVFRDKTSYTYPGKAYPTYVFSYDEDYTEPLGTQGHSYTNFIKMKVGAGNIFIHTQPFCFSNYFLITRNNYHYAEQVFSAMNGKYSDVIWDEYYQSKRSAKNTAGRKWVLSAIWAVPAFRYALLLLLALVVLYFLLESKRKQRLIPVMEKPRNDSLDFTNTIGRLYYETHDNMNLASKMASYFLDHVRTRFRLPTSELSETFVEKLASRTGVDVGQVGYIVSFINGLQQKKKVSDEELMEFHKALENFYHQSR